LGERLRGHTQHALSLPKSEIKQSEVNKKKREEHRQGEGENKK
jgi:hypothetical protein